MNHFKSKLETIQYNAALAISVAIWGKYNIQNGSAPTYLNNIIPQYITPYMTRNQSTIRNFSPRTDLFSSNFFRTLYVSGIRYNLPYVNINQCLFLKILSLNL